MPLNLLDLLSAVGGQAMQAPVQPPQPDVPPPAPADQGPDIEVGGRSIPKSKYKTGIVQGMLRPGSTGGNILGALGDAFLIQSGNKPQYAPRLQGLREQEALENYGSDPRGALDRFSQVAPGAESLSAWNQFDDNRRQHAVAAASLRRSQQEYEDTTNKRGIGLLGAATKDTWPQVRAQVQKYYAARGMEPPFELPEAYDQAKISALRMAGIDPEDQVRSEDTRNYRDAMLAERQAANDELNTYRNKSLSVSERRAAAAERQGNRRLDIQEGGLTERQRSNHAREDYNNAHPRGAGKTGGPAFSVQTMPDGSKRLVKQ